MVQMYLSHDNSKEAQCFEAIQILVKRQNSDHKSLITDPYWYITKQETYTGQ